MARDRGFAQSAERKADNTINAVRQAPCAMRLLPGRRRPGRITGDSPLLV